MFDVVAVNVHTSVVRMIDANRTERDAEAIVNMAVMRRGVDKEFFSVAPTGMYHNGDKWKGVQEA